MSKTNKIKPTFIDLFAGIGGFHLALKSIGMKCVFASEIDKDARETYKKNLKVDVAGDITKINPTTIPDFDIVCGGFPCQPFSQAGLHGGFMDTRGTLFFEIVKIIKAKKPRAFFLENVRGLLKHDNGKTFKTIKNTLETLGYSFLYKIIKASDHGLPQYRPRLYMVGFKGETTNQSTFSFPNATKLSTTMSDIFDGKCNKEIGYTLRVGGRGSTIDDRHNWDAYIVDGKPRRLSPIEAKKMMGLPTSFKLPESETRAMKLLGNSVAIPVVRAIGKRILSYLN